MRPVRTLPELRGYRGGRTVAMAGDGEPGLGYPGDCSCTTVRLGAAAMGERSSDPAATPAATSSRIAGFKRGLAGLRGASAVTNGAYVIVTQVIGKGAATILTLVLARVLTTADFSAFTYTFFTATLLSSYLALGLQFAISRVVSEGVARRSWADDGRLGAILMLNGGVSVAALALAPIYLPWLMSDEVPAAGVLVVIAGLVFTWAALAQAGLYSTGRFREALMPVISGTAFVIVATGIGLFAHSLPVLIWGNIVGAAIPALAYARLLWRDGVLARPHLTRPPGRGAVAAVLTTALPGLGVAIVYASITWLIARTLIEQQATPDQFAQYALGLQWFSLVLFVPLAFGQVLFPRFLLKAHDGDLTAAQIAFPAALTFGTVLACAIVGSLIAPALSWIYGAQYQFAPSFVFTILLAAALSGTVNLLGSYVMAARGTGVWLLVNLASGAIALLLLDQFPPTSAFEAARVLAVIQLTPVAIACAIIRRQSRNAPSRVPAGDARPAALTAALGPGDHPTP